MIYYVGIDNGVSGSIGIVDEMGEAMFAMNTPVVYGQDYTKMKKGINRIDWRKLYILLKEFRDEETLNSPTFRVFI